MRNKLLALAAAALAISAPAYAAKQTVAEKGEARLAKLLEGRIAGEPVNCISALRSDRIQVIDETAIVYDAGNTVYVGRPSDPKSLGRHDILVTDRFGSQLCANDSMRTIDRSGGFLTGIVFIDNFVPYTKQG